MNNRNIFPASYDGVRQLVERLRNPDGCPWDRDQTSDSLKHQLIEECYELLEAIEEDDTTKMVEELGDVLFNVALQIQIARESKRFTQEDVFASMLDKLVRRHPHVFGDVKMDDASEAVTRWDAIKRKELEGSDRSILDGVPKAMPALSYAQAIRNRAARMGFDWDNYTGELYKIGEELRELQEAQSYEEREHELGDVLFTVVNTAAWLDLEAETALRQANSRFYRRFTTMERLSRERGLAFDELPLDRKEELWQESKNIENQNRQDLL